MKKTEAFSTLTGFCTFVINYCVLLALLKANITAVLMDQWNWLLHLCVVNWSKKSTYSSGSAPSTTRAHSQPQNIVRHGSILCYQHLGAVWRIILACCHEIRSDPVSWGISDICRMKHILHLWLLSDGDILVTVPKALITSCLDYCNTSFVCIVQKVLSALPKLCRTI